MLHIGVVLKVRVRVKLSCYQIIQLLCVRRVGESETCEAGIDSFRSRGSDAIYSGAWALALAALSLSDDKGKAEVQLVLISQAQEERRYRCGCAWVRILKIRTRSLDVL